jgi:two-component system, cell cycle response regulator
MHQQREVLLLVDGDVSRAERLASRLGHLHYNVQTAHDGATALLKAHELRPNVVVAATEMPVLDGFRMLDALRNSPQTEDIPVILLMDDCNHEQMAKGWRVGADLCIPRNGSDADVLATLHRALRNSAGREALAGGLALAS